MRAAIFEGSPNLTIREVAKPVVDSESVIIQVVASGICGSDLFHISGNNPRVRPPIILGHEFFGYINTIGSNVPQNSLELGQLVAVNPIVNCGRCKYCLSGRINLCEEIELLGHQRPGGFAEYVKVDFRKLVRIPTTIDKDICHLVEPVAVVVHALSMVKVEAGDKVLVLGGGTIGILTAQLARFEGAIKVAVSDIVEARLKTIEQAGFTALDARKGNIENSVHSCFGYGGADVVVEATGNKKAANQMSKFAAAGTSILVIGLHKGISEVNFRQMGINEQNLQFSRLYTQNDFERAVSLLDAGVFKTTLLGNYRLPLNKINNGFDLARKGSVGLKVVINMRL